MYGQLPEESPDMMPAVPSMGPQLAPEGLLRDDVPPAPPSEGPLLALAAQLLGEFDACRNDRLLQETHWVAALRQYRGLYEPDELATIKNGRSRVFVGITKQKVDATTARMMSLLFPASGERNWSITPTPTPSMDPQIMMMEAQQAMREGRQPRPSQEVAQERADAMDTAINDQLADMQGRKNYRACCRDVMFQALLYGTGLLKGPLAEIRKGRRLGFDPSTNTWGMFPVEDGSADEIRPYFESASVWDVYLDQGTTDVRQMRYVWHAHTMTAKELTEWLAGEPLFDGEAVTAYVREHPDGDVQPYWWETDLRSLGGDAGSTEAVRPKGRYRVYKRWGQISAGELKRAGLDLGIDEARVLDANIWLLGDRVIKIAPVPIAGMGIPFYVMHYHKDESSVWGDGMAWLLRDLQSAVNASIRMALDNAAISAIPQIALNYAALSQNADLSVYPGKVWAFESADDMREAMTVWTIPTSSNQILQIYTLLSQIMDEVSVPRYLSGDNSGVTGAGDTASGLSMLMNAANLTIQDLVRNFDDGVTAPFISAMYSWNMVLNPDPVVKGDFDIVATGSSSLLVKEAESQKMLQIFQITNSPRFLGRVKDDLFISELFKMFNLPDKILRTETEFQQYQLQQMQQQALTQAQAQVTATVQELETRGANPDQVMAVLMQTAGQAMQQVGAQQAGPGGPAGQGGLPQGGPPPGALPSGAPGGM